LARTAHCGGLNWQRRGVNFVAIGHGIHQTGQSEDQGCGQGSIHDGATYRSVASPASLKNEHLHLIHGWRNSRRSSLPSAGYKTWKNLAQQVVGRERSRDLAEVQLRLAQIFGQQIQRGLALL
jgi:hypothetical protein